MDVFDAGVKPGERLSQPMFEFIMRQYIGACHFVEARSVETLRVLVFAFYQYLSIIRLFLLEHLCQETVAAECCREKHRRTGFIHSRCNASDCMHRNRTSLVVGSHS